MAKAPHLQRVLDYANRIAHDESVCIQAQLAGQRFLRDLEDPRFDFRTELAEFCILVIEGLLCLPQGEAMDGTHLRGKPFLLQDHHLFVVYNICGFFWKGTQLRRFTEAGLFWPRKNIKTTFGAALVFSMALYYRRSGAKAKTVAGSLKQGMEAFDFLLYNFKLLDLVADNNPPGYLTMLNSSLGHSFEGEIWDGYIDLETLAFKPELFDSFNAMFVHLDELELYKNAIPYARLRDATKGYSNKLILATFTAGDNANGFAARHHEYLEKILRGTITGEDADRMFAFLWEAPVKEDGDVDYLDPAVHRAANPGWEITIRPGDMMAAALQAQNNPELLMEFKTRSLNLFVSSFKAWFNLDEFRRSDQRYKWTQEEAARLIKAWYGGADLSKLHDLTAADIVGEIPAKLAATEDWTPPEDVLVVLPHCWFPITAATEKAQEDQIPLFGWQKDGWLDMPNEPSMDPTEPVKQFKSWRSSGFKIKKIGHDRKFARTFFTAIKEAGFKTVDQPQLAYLKSEGLRYIEHKAKIGCLYYFHAEPYAYCISNVRGQEKQDDIVQYEKIDEHSRIDVFDASVFAVIRMLIDTEKISGEAGWFGGKRDE